MNDTPSNEWKRSVEFSETTQFLPIYHDLDTQKIDRFEKRISRYKLPLSWLDYLRTAWEEQLAVSSVSTAHIGWPPLFLANPNYPIDPEWQLIFNYLHKEGVVQSPKPFFDEVYNDDPKIYSLRLWAAPSPTDGIAEIGNGRYSRGVAHDFPEAVSKVIGELLERYALSIYRRKNLYRFSIADLRRKGAQFLDPFLVDRFSRWQKQRFPRRQFDADSFFSFVRGRSLMRGVDAFIPAQMVFLNYLFDTDEPILCEPNSNGAGGMFTYEEAVLAGLYELIQRDAFLLTWLQKVTPQRIDLSSIRSPELQDQIHILQRYHLELHILQIPSDLTVPVFVAVIIDRTGVGPAVALGGGCGRIQETAILRAITEAEGVRLWLRQTREQNEKPLPDTALHEAFSDENFGAYERLLSWSDLKNLEHLNFLLSGVVATLDYTKDRVFLSPKAELADCVSEFQTRGNSYEIFVYRATHPVLDRLGYSSVKVCVPALLPLYLREVFAPLGAKRLHPFTHRQGGPHQINPIPHPFP